MAKCSGHGDHHLMLVKLTQGYREFWFQFCHVLVRCSVYIVCPSVLSCSNFKLHQTLEVFYNIALAKRAFWLAKKLDLFTRGLLTSIYLYFLSAIDADKQHKKHNSYFGDEEDYSFELRNFLPGLQLMRFANLSEELNQLVEQRVLGTRRPTKTTTKWTVSTLRG